jgi:hypothetical protein
VKVLRPPSFDLRPSIAIVRVGQLGALEKAVGLLEQGIRQLLEATAISGGRGVGARSKKGSGP